MQWRRVTLGGPLDNILFEAPVWHWDKHFSVWIIVFRYFAILAGCQVGLGILQARESCHNDSRHCPRVRGARAMPCPSRRVA